MVKVVELPARNKNLGIEDDIHNLKVRLKMQKEAVAKTEAEIRILEEQLEK